jgi:hypothetical protein
MNVKFLTTLDVRDIDDHQWQLLAPFVVEVDGAVVRVPAGFVTDFASVPRLPVSFALFGNIGHRAAVVHDWLYSTGERPREEADAILKALLRAEGVGAFRANAMYAGVRMGGASHYKNPA